MVVAQAMAIPRFPGEEVAQFFRRRAHVAGFEARRMGMWSDRDIVLVCRFHDQILAEAPPVSWPAHLLGWLGNEWVRERRVVCGSDSVFAGRIGSRLPGGHVAPRWGESVRLVQDMHRR